MLAGNVRQKLAETLAAKEEGVQGLDPTIAALEKVVPESIPYPDIEVNLGATWIESQDYVNFFAHLLNTNPEWVHVERFRGRWRVRGDRSSFQGEEATSVWGYPGVPFAKLASAAMNNTSVKVYGEDKDGNKVLDETATAEANEKINGLREELKNWIWADPERIDRLSATYNNVFNSYYTPNYDGSHLSLEGLALSRGEDPFSFRKHQQDAVWRGLVTGRGIYAHEVGTGKTYTTAGLAIESKRLGLSSKPLLFAHNANSL